MVLIPNLDERNRQKRIIMSGWKRQADSAQTLMKYPDSITKSSYIRCPEAGGMCNRMLCLILVFLLQIFSIQPMATAQQSVTKSRRDEPRITKTGDFKGTGIVRDIERGVIVIENETGVQQRYKIQDADEDGISIGGMPLQVPALIQTNGTLKAELLEKGMYVEFSARVNESGEFEHPLEHLRVVSPKKHALKLDIETRQPGEEFANCRVVGRVSHISKRDENFKLLLEVTRAKPAVRGHISVLVSKDAKFSIREENLNRILPGDTVEYFKGISLSNGQRLIVTIKVRMSADRKKTTLSFHDQLEQKFSHLSDRPVKPRRVRNEHFILHTDISDRSAKILLAKLKRTYTRLFRYFGRQPRDAIECYVVADISQWEKSDQIPASAMGKIAEGTGLTTFSRVTGYPKSIVYSCDDHGVVQHEAVHAFCNLAYGSCGPVWFAEGMAELGLYWRPDELDVQIEPVVIDFLTESRRKKLDEIIAPNQRTGDSWEAYAWRWALCHLMSSNKNYAKKFKRLGVDMMSGEEASFEASFQKDMNRIAFEYDQFIRNFNNGYRVDLCVWDWSIKPKPLVVDEQVKVSVLAKSGWQATPIKIQKGTTYEFVDSGKSKWKIREHGAPLSASGDSLGNGQLVGAIFKDYKLSKPIELGARGSFRAPASGQLFLRCREKWTALDDNDGKVVVHIRRKPRKK